MISDRFIRGQLRQGHFGGVSTDGTREGCCCFRDPLEGSQGKKNPGKSRELCGKTFPRDRKKTIFSTFWGEFLTNYIITQKTWRKRENSTGENSKNPVETAPRNCIFLSLVVVERILISRIATCFKFQDFGHRERQACCEPWSILH